MGTITQTPEPIRRAPRFASDAGISGATRLSLRCAVSTTRRQVAHQIAAHADLVAFRSLAAVVIEPVKIRRPKWYNEGLVNDTKHSSNSEKLC